jgi:RNA polymerase sigma factor (sigma-70 family)
MANPETWSRTMPLADEHGVDEHGVEELFRTRYLEMVRLAGLLGADDPEDLAQEAFTRLMRRHLDEPQAAAGYLRAIVVNLTRNRHRHPRVVRMRTPAAVDEGSSEQAAIVREDHREVIAALAGLPARRREAIVLRYWLDRPEREIAGGQRCARDHRDGLRWLRARGRPVPARPDALIPDRGISSAQPSARIGVSWAWRICGLVLTPAMTRPAMTRAGTSAGSSGPGTRRWSGWPTCSGPTTPRTSRRRRSPG